MRTLSPRSYTMLVLGLSGWSLACGDGAIEPTLPADPATLERAVLTTLYEATGGDEWTRSDNWLSAAPLGEWYGVTVGADGRVTRLRLPSNNLSGRIPPELGNLASLESLSLSHNDLSGRIPPELGSLSSLAELFLHNNRLSGGIPPELGSLASLERLIFDSNELSGRIPPELGSLSSVRQLVLSRNDLAGPIPAELTNLALEELSLAYNDLSGPIPRELGGIPSLKRLYLLSNHLSGPIPPELGQLTSLERLYLNTNNLSGSVPSELGNLVALEYLALSRNELSGPLPLELGNISSLQRLWLYSNELSGPIPPELGGLPDLELLRLESNNLQGPVPAELGQLSALGVLALSNNSGLSGRLPSSFTALRALEELLAGGTDLCAPSDADFVEWLGGIQKLRLARCDAETGSAAYLIQAVQSREFPVPLVAGEEAVLRVFVTTARPGGARIPPVRATFYLSGAEVHVVEIPGKSAAIPSAVVEGDFRMSSNAGIPAEVLQPGLEMVIEVDPGGTLGPELGVSTRIPETGRLAVDVRAMPVLDLTLIPLIWSEQPQRRVVDLVSAMAADPGGHELLSATRSLLPVTGLSVMEHAPVTTTTNNSSRLLGELNAIRTMEGGSGHYMGIMERFEEQAGRAYRPGRISVSVPNPTTMAHELGHNMSLQHAPCGDPDNPDPSFPDARGRIGAWGFDSRQGGTLMSPALFDLMSYCNPSWISDYHFTNALAFRLRDEVDDETSPPAPARSLLLWGGVGARGVPYLEPAFVTDAPPVLPDSLGDYQLTGRTADGREIFSLSFTMPEVADGDGGSSFVFALPVRAGWAGNLAAITLSGPGGMATLDGDTDRPMVILRDPRTGQVRGILRGVRPEELPRASPAADQTPGAVPGVVSSRGIPDADAWRP